jgi:hypothetical protein
MRFLFFILAISIPTLISAEKISFELRKKHFSVIPEGFCEPEKGSQAEKNFTKHSDLMERAGLERPILMLVDCEYNTGDRSQFFSTFYMYPENNSVSRFSRELINSIFKCYKIFFHFLIKYLVFRSKIDLKVDEIWCF